MLDPHPRHQPPGEAPASAAGTLPPAVTRCTVIPLHPVRRAYQALQDVNRTDLRQITARLVVAEVQAGRDGLSVARQLQSRRLRQKPQGGAA